MSKIALLVPICSRGQNYIDLSSTSFFTYFYPNLIHTMENIYQYTIFLGYDSSDEFFTEEVIHMLIQMCNIMNRDINVISVKLNRCEHKPAKAWNKLFKQAILKDFDYYYQIGDDVVMETKWTSKFIEVLRARNNIGVVGGCHNRNYIQRRNIGRPAVIENAFVHKTHYQIFKTFFDENIENWYCDDWLTEVYKPDNSTHLLDVTVMNKVGQGEPPRYNIRNIGHSILGLIEKGKHRLVRFNSNGKCSGAY